MDTGLRQRAVGLSAVTQSSAAGAIPDSALRLSRKTIYILPTAQGIVFGFGALTVMLLAMVERNPVALLLGALMLSVFLLGLILCYRNVSGLQLQAVTSGTTDCFAGDPAQFAVQIKAAGTRRRHQHLWLGFSADSLTPVSLAAGAEHTLTLLVATDTRGVLLAPRLLLRTVYPAGLWRAWSRPDLGMSCLVYPRPLPCGLPVSSTVAHSAAAGTLPTPSLLQGGVDDFIGLRAYRPGDSLRHIAWQTLARGQGLKTRQFVREPDQAVMLDWDQFVSRDSSSQQDINKEQILSFLCYQILALSRQHKTIGLRMPGMLIRPAQGEIHQQQMLEVLARWP